jgi:hypothetical protein
MNDFEKKILNEAVEKTINETRKIKEEEETIKIFKSTLCNIQKYKEYLRDILQEKENEVIQLKYKLINYCNNSIYGHDFRIEIESGHYGETYTICKKCGYEK